MGEQQPLKLGLCSLNYLGKSPEKHLVAQQRRWSF
jgi:hypothetical protein